MFFIENLVGILLIFVCSFIKEYIFHYQNSTMRNAILDWLIDDSILFTTFLCLLTLKNVYTIFNMPIILIIVISLIFSLLVVFFCRNSSKSFEDHKPKKANLWIIPVGLLIIIQLVAVSMIKGAQ